MIIYRSVIDADVDVAIFSWSLCSQVGLFWPILYIAASVFLVFVPLVTNPVEAGNLLSSLFLLISC